MMIEFKNGSVTRSNVPVLTDVTLSLPKGSMTVIFGGGASGKSTIAGLISGNLEPASGTVELNGASAKKTQTLVGVISPSLALLDDRSIYDNIALPLELAGHGKKRVAESVTSVIHRFGLADVQQQFPSSVSSGLKQKAAIARAVVSEPFILVADEPTLHLDRSSANDVAESLSREQLRGMTVVVLTSNAEFRDLFLGATHVML